MGKTKNNTKISARGSKGEAVHKLRGVGGSVLGALWQGIGNLIDIVADMEEKGLEEFTKKGTMQGKTQSGKDVRGEYAFHVRTGLDVIREREKKEMEQGEEAKGEK